MFPTIESCRLALVPLDADPQSTSSPYVLFMRGYLRRRMLELRAVAVKEALLELRDYATSIRSEEILGEIRPLLPSLLDGSMRIDDANLTRVEVDVVRMLSRVKGVMSYEEFLQSRRYNG
jgi:hypothetical protein